MGAKRGPAPTPTLKLHQAGSWRAKTRNGEPIPPKGAPDHPPDLDGESFAEWQRIVPSLAGQDLLTSTDRAILFAYCTAWANLVEAIQMARDEPRFVVTKKGSAVRHPAQTNLQACQSTFLRFAQELGLSPAARTRIQVLPGGKGADENARFFA